MTGERVREDAVGLALDGQGGELHLDLSELTFVDSTGMKTLVSLHSRVESLGRRLVIVSPTRPVRRVLAVVGLDEVLDVRPPNVPTVVPLLAVSTDAG
jgi:anti-anti-sigma factor